MLEEAGVPRIPDLAAADALILDLRRSILIVAELRDYALECLRFNARPRDAFAGARRGQSFEILGIAGRLFDLPEALDMARQALRRSRSQRTSWPHRNPINCSRRNIMDMRSECSVLYSHTSG